MLALVATVAVSSSFTAPTKEKATTVMKLPSKRYVTACGFSTIAAADQAAINVPISPLEIRGEILVLRVNYAGENGDNYCYSFWVISLM